MALAEQRQGLQLSDLPRVVGYLAAVAMAALATVVAVGFDTAVAVPNLSLVYVIPVVVSAVLFGLGPSLSAAVLGALSFNFFFTEPLYSLRVDDPANIWAIGLLFLVGCISSAVASTAQRKANDAARHRQQAQILQGYSHAVIAAKSNKAILSLTAATLDKLFGVPAVVIISADAKAELAELRGGLTPSAVEFEAATASLASRKRVPAAVYPFDESRFDFWPAPTADGPSAVIGLAFDPEERPAEPGLLAELVANLLSLALARQTMTGRPVA
ncbi:DUF4118 domain-containing protein [Bosea sp. BK604]|uniref:DUF4118 domain-containing protein n=1 Tax=Bosea sp. BK604 TaxID=2512180 RepID=UPI0014045283|nr:DUF4118 domain-containing protein [Bosea sp. BK604]